MPKRLLFLAPQPFFCERGTPIAEKAVLEVLGERDWTVDLLTYPSGRDVDIAGCSIHRIPSLPLLKGIPPGFSLRKLAADGLMAGRARRMIAWRDYALIHAVEESVFIAMAARSLHGVPYIYDMDSSLPDQLMDQVGAARLLAPFLHRAETAAIRSSFGVLTMCRALEEKAREVLGSDAVVGRVEDAAMDSGSDGTERLSEVIGSTEPIVLYVGNLMPYQGIDLLLESFARAAGELPEGRLVIIGGEAGRQEHYRRRAAELELTERVHLIGPRPVDQLGWYLRQATVLVSPRTTGTNTPMKLYSYLDSGVPVLATRLLTHTQVVDDSTAVLREPEPVDFAEGLIRLMSDRRLRQRTAAAAADLVEREFTPTAQRRKLNDFYETVEEELEQREAKEPRPQEIAGRPYV